MMEEKKKPPIIDLGAYVPKPRHPKLLFWNPVPKETFRERAERLSKYEYRTREDVERFIVFSPQSFFEKVESDQEFRENMQELLKCWDHHTIYGLAWYVQERGHRNELEFGKPMLVEPIAFHFANWLIENARAIYADPYHKLTSFKEYRHKKEQEHLQMEQQEQKEREERKAKQEHLERARFEEQLRQNIIDFAVKMDELFRRMIEMGGKLSIFDPQTQKTLIGFLPDELKTGDNVVDAAMGVLFFENPETVLDKVRERMANDATFRKYMVQHGVDAQDVNMQNSARVFQIIGGFVKEQGKIKGDRIIEQLIGAEVTRARNKAFEMYQAGRPQEEINKFMAKSGLWDNARTSAQVLKDSVVRLTQDRSQYQNQYQNQEQLQDKQQSESSYKITASQSTDKYEAEQSNFSI